MKLDILKGHWVDMLFEGRNKSYGAYVLRKESPKTTIVAYIIGASLFVGLLAIPLISSLTEKEEVVEDVTLVDMAKMDAPKKAAEPKVLPPKPTTPPPPPAPRITEVKFVKPQIVKKEEVTEEIKTVEELKNSNVGSADVKGRDDGKIAIDDAPSGTGDPNSQVTEAAEDNQIYTSVEVNAEFPGGIAKFYSFIQGNFRYPDENINGKVIAKFVIEKDGSVGDVIVMRDLGYGTKEEAMRVIRKSPKWKPAMQNGHAARVWYIIPISIQTSGN